MELRQMAEWINCLGRFCGKRDLEALIPALLKEKYGITQADVMVLFGGSILCGGDVLAEAMKNGIAKHYVIVGGAGHTTETLREKMHEEFPAIQTAGLSEAEVFEGYLEYRYGLKADFLECASTNCGNNITFLLTLLKEKGISFQSIILVQDASMQRRMEAGLRKYCPDAEIISFAAYQAEVIARETERQRGEKPESAEVSGCAEASGPVQELVFKEKIWGMWDMERYITLLMGEIPRLTDDSEGYGPRGKDYIAHVEIPPQVRKAFEELKKPYGGMIRKADSRYASAAGQK